MDSDRNEVRYKQCIDIGPIWKYTYSDVVLWCRENIKDFKQSKIFIVAKKGIDGDANCVYNRKLDNRNSKSASQKFYTDEALRQIKQNYEKAVTKVKE